MFRGVCKGVGFFVRESGCKNYCRSTSLARCSGSYLPIDNLCIPIVNGTDFAKKLLPGKIDALQPWF